jgi:hypothetical protein
VTGVFAMPYSGRCLNVGRVGISENKGGLDISGRPCNRHLDRFIGRSLANGADGREEPIPLPNIMVPQRSFETMKPVLPRVPYSMMPSNG